MEQDNATPTGAESLQPAHAGRNAALAQIATAVNASYQQDMAAFNEETGEIAAKPKAEPEKVEAAAEVEQQEEQQQESQEAIQQTQTQAPQDEMETIVVDGQQVQVKRTQLLDAGKRTLQKEATADKRLAEAAEIRRQAEAFLNAARRQPSQDADTQVQSPSSDATNEDGRQQVRATPQDWDALVDQRLYLRDAEKAAQKFKAEFPEITQDPLLARLVSQLEDERIAKAVAEGTPLGDPWEAYKGHGETIKSRFIKPATSAQSAVSEDRQERKRSTTTVVGAGARAQSPQPQKTLTTAEQIEKMRIARMGRAIPMSKA